MWFFERSTEAISRKGGVSEPVEFEATTMQERSFEPLHRECPPMQVPDRNEYVSSFADGVALGVAPEGRGQHIICQRSPDQDGRLRVQSEGLCQDGSHIWQLLKLL
jgi:hypothetical protein